MDTSLEPQKQSDIAKPATVLCCGEVIHKRVRPAKNAFRYGVFFIRVPLRNLQDQTTGNKLRFFSLNRFNLLSFHERDHGDGKQPLIQWLDNLLHAENVHDADGEVWLQCFPRVFGYVFNPVSFWFCHRTDGGLRAIVCEVRNTFGEKHLYLLENGATLSFGEELHAKKIFHVSPFCNVEGGYRFRFMQANKAVGEQEKMKYLAKIDYDDAHGPLLLTSVSGTEADMTNGKILKVMLRYPFMTIGVMLRIHIQAMRLWFKRVPFFSKPLPPSEELSR